MPNESRFRHQRSRGCRSFATGRKLRAGQFDPSPEFQLCLSVSLYTEWQDVLTRTENLSTGRTAEDTRRYLRYLASASHLQEIHFLWRPFLPDADDDMILELAFAAGCRYIVTHNVKDFRGSEELGITAVTPRDFLKQIRSKS